MFYKVAERELMVFYTSSRIKGIEVLAKFPWKVGIVTFMLFPELIKSDEEASEKLRVLIEDPFFDLLEVGYIGDEEWVKIKNLKQLKEFARALQPEILVEGYNPNAIDEERRREAEALLVSETKVAGKRGMKAVALCSGPIVSKELKGKAIEALVKTLKAVADEASKHNMIVLLETFDYKWDKKRLIGPLPEAVKVIDAVRESYRNIYLMWDLSHGPLLDEDPEVLSSYPDYIGHIHIGCAKKVGNKLYDSHPGFHRPGALNTEKEVAKLLSVLHKIKYRGAVSFEVKPEENQSPLEILNTAKSVLMRAYQLFLESEL